MKKILFRSDSSSDIGLGHIMRDLVLAKGLQKNYDVIFASQNLLGNINDIVVANAFFLHVIQSNDLDELVKVINKYKIDIIIIDHYGIDYFFEKKLKQKTNVHIVAMDDSYNKHYCDAVLNHNPGAQSNRYDALVPKNALKFCGIKYTLIRNEFREAQKKSGSKHKIKKNQLKVLVMMGGSDPKNITCKIVKDLLKNKNYELHVITTRSNRNLKSLQALANKNKNIVLHVNTEHISLLMKAADLAIISPSVTAAEALYMRLPFIAIKTAQNQQEIVAYLKQKRLPVLQGYQKTVLKAALHKCIKNYDNIMRRLKTFHFSKNSMEYII